MHSRICLFVGVMRRTVIQRNASAILCAPKLTLDGTVPHIIFSEITKVIVVIFKLRNFGFTELQCM